MTEREKLFESALTLFGGRSHFSEAVQNPNCVNSEQELDALYREAEKFIEAEQEQERVRILKGNVYLWMSQLREAHRAGQLKE